LLLKIIRGTWLHAEDSRRAIAELEGTTRGPYGGCVGYFSFSGNLGCCITIRTALIKDGSTNVPVPTSRDWVNDSEPEAEFQETVNKSKAIHPPQ
jgi:anthranilate synthase component 1